MLKQFSALMLCAIAALCLAVAGDSNPEPPKMVDPRPLDPAVEIKLLRAIAALQAANSNARTYITGMEVHDGQRWRKVKVD